MSDTNEVDKARQMTVDKSGNNWVYPSASASGHVEIVLPAAHGPNSEERLLVKDFGTHVAQEVERSLTNLYPVSSPRKSATVTFAHYVGAARGASLLDEPALRRMEGLAKEFESVPEQREFFKQVVKPYLWSLRPKRR